MSVASHTVLVKSLSQRHGFDACGVAMAQPLDEDARRLEAWLHKGMHGGMAYMENHFDLRIDPTKLVPGAKSVITLLKNYYPSATCNSDVKISKYAWGEDYHTVIRGALNAFLDDLRTEVGDVAGRGFVDSAPVLERAWAVRSGLGWVGKNSNLIAKGAGSFFFIATLVTDLALQPDAPFAADYCGSCNRCVEACPTGAILPDKTVNGSQCISYYTIELKDALMPATAEPGWKDWAFGCDTCQDVCPWNRFAKAHNEAAFTPIPEVLNLSSREWEGLTEEAFRNTFKRSPISRTKWKGMQRNVKFLREAQG